MTALVRFPTQIAKLIPRLASDHDGEVLATVHAISRTLKSAGLDFHAVASACEHGHAARHAHDAERTQERSWHAVAVWCRDRRSRLSPKEASFVSDMAHRLVLGGEPTEKQAAWLRAIYAKVGGGAC